MSDKLLQEYIFLLQEVIRKCGNKWCLYSKKKIKGKHKKLGTHSTKEKAIAQEKAIEISKHK